MNFPCVGALVLCCLAAVSLRADEPRPWTVKGNLPRDRFVVQAHRGAGELAEENTLEAFTLGWSLNCVPEADVRTTKDGVIVPFHDANFARVVRDVDPVLAKKGVKDLTFDELRRLDVGAWRGDTFTGRRVGRLREIFEAMRPEPSRRLYLDIKDVDLDQLAGEVKEAGVGRQVIFASTKYPLLRRWKALLPDGQTLLWMGGTEAELGKRFESLRETNFADVTQLQIHVHLVRPAEEITRTTADPFEESDAFLRARFDEVRGRGILAQSLPWKGSTAGVYQKLLDLGCMSFATDHPHATWEAIDAYYAAP